MPRLGTKGSNKKTVVGELRRTQVITTYVSLYIKNMARNEVHHF